MLSKISMVILALLQFPHSATYLVCYNKHIFAERLVRENTNT